MTMLAAEAAEQAKARARARAQAAPRQYASQARGIRSPGTGKYQTAILAEFLIAAGVVAFTPLATGGPSDNASPSPYTVNDLTQLAAIGAVYFLLAVIPGRGARWSAWFGLLILLGLMCRKFATGELTAAITGIHPATPSSEQTV